MRDTVRKYGFAAVVGGTLAVLGVAAGVRVLGDGAGGANGAPGGGPSGGQAAASAPRPPGGGGGGPGGGGRGGPAAVEAAAIVKHTFYDVTPAIGTTQALESITLSSKVTDVIRRIRFESGQFVRRGDVLVELANVEQSADLDEARASLEVERRGYERIKELSERGFAPRARLEEAQAAFERAQARVEALQSRIQDRTIRAPFSGVVGLRQASAGALVRPGDVIATLDDITSVKLDFDISETQIGQVRAGAELVAKTAAFPDQEFVGRIDQLDTRVDPQARTLKVRAILPNPDRKLRPGMLMTVQVRANPRETIAAPEIAVLDSGEGSYVFRIEEAEGRTTVARVDVETGQRADGVIEIRSGLAEGDRVVSVGVQRVRPGQPVRIEAAASPAAAKSPAAPAAPARS